MQIKRMFDKLNKLFASIIIISLLFLGFPENLDLAFGETVNNYNANAAVSYAEAHYNDNETITTPGRQDCTQFVRECLEAGGVPKDTNRVNENGPYGYTVAGYRDYLTNNGYAQIHELTREKQEWETPQWYVRAEENKDRLSIGDGILYFCDNCKTYFHMSIVTSIGNDGFARYHAQSSAVNGEILCAINCGKCGSNSREHVRLYSIHITSQDNGFSSEYNDKSVSNLTAVRTGNDTLSLKWDSVAGVIGYKLFIKNGKNSVFNLLTETTGNNFTYTEKEEGVGAYFAVRPYFEKDGKTYVGNLSNTIYNNDYLGAPKGVAAKSNTDGSITVTWNKVAGADQYDVYKSTSEDGQYTKINSIVLTGTSFTTSKDLQPGTTYYFKVKAIKNSYTAGNSSLSLPASVTIDAPNDAIEITATVNDEGKPKITWTKVNGAAEYQVYRSTVKSGTYTKILTTKANSCTNSTAKIGTTYYYKVKAISSSGKILQTSNIVSKKCIIIKPKITKVTTSYGKPKLTWSKVSGASKYQVYRAASKNGTYTRMTTTSNTSYTNTTAKAGTTYYYKVRAVAGNGVTSSYSTIVNQKCIPRTPLVKITTSYGKPKLTWDKVSGASKYQVYRATSKSGTYTRMTTTSRTSYTNSSAKPGTTYYYKVRAVTSNGTTGFYSSIVSKKCVLAAPSVKSTTSYGKPKLTWGKVSGASKYQVYRATSKNGAYTRMATTTGTTYKNTSAKAGKTYYYKVKAVGSNTSIYTYSKIVTIRCTK